MNTAALTPPIDRTHSDASPLGKLAALWGVAGVLGLLGQALYRLTPLAVEPWADGSMSHVQIAICLSWVLVSAYSEGYRGFQKRFSPRVVARARHLAQNPRPLFVAFAPLFCMSFFHATRKGKIVAWSISSMVICFIVLLRRTPQPWRGIVDSGVVVGLTWGAFAIVYFAIAALLGREPPVAADLPD